ncbi:MAG: phage holin family protein [Amaricoccus sp.]
MVRLIARTVVELAANAIGLIAAAWLLPGFTLSVSAFILTVAIFTAIRFILAPLIFKLAFKYARAITGGIALVTTFVGLLLTSWLSSGLVITGAGTWLMATLIVWLFGVVGLLVLPMVIFKKTLAARPNTPNIPPLR